MLYLNSAIKVVEAKSMNVARGAVGDQDGLHMGRGLPAADSDLAGRSTEAFNTQHLLSDLKRHTISGGMVTMSAQAAKFLMNLLSTVVLARLLTPRDFGLVAM